MLLRRVWPALLALVFTIAPRAQRDLAEWSGDPWPKLQALEVATDGPTEIVVRKLGKPVAGADVYVLDEAAIDRATWLFVNGSLSTQFGGTASFAVAARHAKRYRCDENGIARIHLPERARTFARHEDAIGFLFAHDTSHAIQLIDHRRIPVEVVDHEGRPAEHVPITARAQHGPVLATGCTGRGGRTNLWVPIHPGPPPQLEVVAAVIARSPVSRAVTKPEATGRMRVTRVELPPVGSVLIEVPESPAGMNLDELGSQLACFTERMLFVPPSPFGPARRTREGIRFDRVVLDESFVCTLGTDQNVVSSIKLRGPAEAGKVAKTKLSFDDDLLLVGRALLPDGSIIAKAQVTVLLTATGTSAYAMPRTDANGGFCFRIPEDLREARDLRIELRERYRGATQQQRREQGHAILIAPPDQDTGIVDIGEQRLQLEPVLLAGRVLSPDGKPVANVQLTAPPSQRRNDRFQSAHYAYTDEQGRFAFYELSPSAGELSVILYAKPGSPPDHRKVTIGDTDIELRLAPLCTVEATLKDGANSNLVTASLLPRTVGRQQLPVVPFFNGKASFRNLAPGTYSLVVRLCQQELTRIDSFEVTLDGKNDARLSDIEWHDKVRFFAIKATDANGNTARPNLYLGKKGGALSPPLVCGLNGRAKVPLLDDYVILARHSRFRCAIIDPQDKQSFDLVMRPRARLRLRIPDGLTLPKEVRISTFDATNELGIPRANASWQPHGDTVITVESQRTTTLEVKIGSEILYEQEVSLPDHGDITDVLLDIDQSIADTAHELARRWTQIDRRGDACCLRRWRSTHRPRYCCTLASPAPDGDLGPPEPP